MKPISTLVQFLVLSACFAIHQSGAGEAQMTGLRRALQTIAVSVNVPAMQDLPGIAMAVVS